MKATPLRTHPAARCRPLMRVLMVSTSYPRDASDWRGIFMAYLAGALARADQVQLALWAPPGELHACAAFATSPREADWLSGLMARGGISHWMRTQPLAGLAAAWRLLRLLRAAYRRLTDVDIYHINWLQCALPLPDNGKPALITVLGNDMKLLRLPLMRAALRRAMRGRKVAICPNARWMDAPLRAAFGDVATVIPVVFGIDPLWYAIERDIRAGEPRRWLAVTRLTANKLGPLFEWSEPLFRDGARELHLFGPMQENIAVPAWVHYHGSATPEQLAGEWFPRAHGLVTLSRHAEGRPQVMLEAMAAGLPIVASRMPAHADIVADGVTGALCDSAAAYADALRALEDIGTNRRFGAAARAWAAREIGTWDDCAGRYVDIYRRLLGRDADA
ncbi:MAG: glycosyltransferase [Mizugakiibacter sp.]|uniref:glycosyltransferase n=1 Tax=Mizugakiibacter sp. TaxID=1972610 RepID=UPI0031C15601|nr:glycosyltransferase [Xanthomonadaceae bacterium]